MTCIVGLAVGGKVHIGGDSAGVDGWDLTVRADTKVFTRGPFIMGFCGSFRMGQLLRYRLSVPEHESEYTIDAYMVGPFVDAVRDCLSAGGFTKIKHERERGGEFLVGYQGRLFSVEGDFQVGEAQLPFHAIGCGGPFALGAMHAQPKSKTPAQRIRAALTAAEQFSGGVRSPFVVMAAA